MLGHRSPRQLETVRAIDASAGLSPGDGQIRVHDGSPMDAVPRRGSFPTAFRDSSAIAAVDAGSTNGARAWRCTAGRRTTRASRAGHTPIRSIPIADATHWSATTRLNPGDRPVVVHCPATLSPAACYDTSCPFETRSRTPDPWNGQRQAQVRRPRQPARVDRRHLVQAARVCARGKVAAGQGQSVTLGAMRWVAIPEVQARRRRVVVVRVGAGGQAECHLRQNRVPDPRPG